MRKCESDLKCIDESVADDLCSTVIHYNCPVDSPYQCNDGHCRIDEYQCSSKPACPVGHKMCPD